MTNANDFTNQIAPLTATIASSGTVSDAVNLYGTTAVALQLPSAFTGTLFYIQVSIDAGSTFKRLADQDGTDRTYTVTADKIYWLDPAILIGADQVKIESNDTEAAERAIKIKPVSV